MKYTPEQLAAINKRGCDILVSAAAGSGKTGVLTERILAHLREGDSIDELLTLTFTRAAAGEMRKRIREKITDELRSASQEQRSFWQNQLDMLVDAPITTIHSFCMRLLRRHYNLIPGLDPKFKIIDDKRAAVLRGDLLDKYIEKCYIRESPDENACFFRLLRCFGNRLGDEGLKNEIIRLMEFSCSQGDPRFWLQESLKRFGDFDFWYRTALEDARQEISGLMEETKDDLTFLNRVGGPDGCIVTLQNDLAGLSAVLESDWEGIGFAKPFGRKKPKTKDDDPDVDEYIKNRRDKRKEYYAEIVSVFQRDYPSCCKEIAEYLPLMETLVQLTCGFWELFREEKLKNSVLEFGDLEYNALMMLEENTSLAEEYRSLFKEVLVDEYQDINPLQNRILSLLTGKEKSFAVGDIKQSIYGFRFADCDLFRKKSEKFGSGMTEDNGLLIHLNKNFRSRREILGTANQIFSRLMNYRGSQIRYGEKEALYFSSPLLKDSEIVPTELFVIDRSGVSQDESYASAVCHGKLIAREIRKMMDSGFCVSDRNGKKRPLSYGDVMILTRSPNTCSSDIASELLKNDIPFDDISGDGFLSGMETKMITSFLAVLDNPFQDIPLASVMRSFLFDFDENELMYLCSGKKCRKLWDMVLSVSENNGIPVRLKEKTIRFMNDIKKWRVLSNIYGAGDLVRMFLSEYDFTAFCGGLSNGRRRIKNIQLYTNEAEQWQAENGVGIFDFLRYLDYLEKNGGDKAENEVLESDSVRILSIHKSKGLEFPVVFLAYTEKQFNKEDQKKALLLDKDLGFGPQYIDFNHRIKYSCLPKTLIKKKIKKQSFEEELRVMYVAMTRASEKLIITACDEENNGSCLEEKIRKKNSIATMDGTSPIPLSLLIKSNSYYQWLLYSLPLFNHDFDCNLHFTIVNAEMGIPDSGICNMPFRLSEEERAQINSVLTRKAVHGVPSKVSVTSLLPDSGLYLKDLSIIRFRPSFMNGDNFLSAAEKGSLFHAFMENIDFKKDWTHESLQNLISEFAKDNSFSDNGIVDEESVMYFLNSDYGKDLKVSANIRREMSFTCGFHAYELFPDEVCRQDNVILQGAIDLLYQRSDKSWVLLDYKTNHLKEDDIEGFLNHYGKQMELYAGAMKKLYGIEIKDCVFYMTAMRRFIPYCI